MITLDEKALDAAIATTPFGDAARVAMANAITAYLSTAPSGQAPLEGVHSDDLDKFAEAMKAKLKWEREVRERGGWDDPAKCSVEYLARLLIEHLGKGNAGTFEDVANFAMMLHQRGADPKVLAAALLPASAEPVAWQMRRLTDGIWSNWCEIAEDTAAHFSSLNRTDYQVRALYASPPASGAVEAGWQTMESAPKDGDRTPFFAWHKIYGLCSAKWGKEPKDLLFFRQIHSDNYAQVNADGIGWTEHLHDFTGWQPLPAAPTEGR